MRIVDFTNMPQKNKAYAGANGNKISILYDGRQHMLKFPPAPTKNEDMSYTNSCFSEYLGCQIFASIGIPVQKTMLGTYSVNGKEKIVVACEDFTSPGVEFQDFASLKNKIIDSARNGYGTELSDIIDTFSKQRAVDEVSLSDRFWDMFIVDAFIGNWDRHNGNWGFLYNTFNDTVSLAPVFDCGSSLYPQAGENIMKEVLADKAARNLRIYEKPTSAILEDGKKIKYFDFLTSIKNADCNNALMRITPRINMSAITDIINSTPFLSDLQKEFYVTMLTERKEKILDVAYEKVLSVETAELVAAVLSETSTSTMPTTDMPTTDDIEI